MTLVASLPFTIAGVLQREGHLEKPGQHQTVELTATQEGRHLIPRDHVMKMILFHQMDMSCLCWSYLMKTREKGT